jgi:hypothetical protein
MELTFLEKLIDGFDLVTSLYTLSDFSFYIKILGELHHLTKIFKFSIYILSCFHVIIGIIIVHCGKL